MKTFLAICAKLEPRVVLIDIGRIPCAKTRWIFVDHCPLYTDAYAYFCYPFNFYTIKAYFLSLFNIGSYAVDDVFGRYSLMVQIIYRNTLKTAIQNPTLTWRISTTTQSRLRKMTPKLPLPRFKRCWTLKETRKGSGALRHSSRWSKLISNWYLRFLFCFDQILLTSNFFTEQLQGNDGPLQATADLHKECRH